MNKKKYYCSRCGYNNKLKSNLKRHLNRKIPCKPLVGDISIKEIYKKYFKIDNNNDVIQYNLASSDVIRNVIQCHPKCHPVSSEVIRNVIRSHPKCIN